MDEPTREEIGDLLRRLVDTAVEMKDRADLPPTDEECLRNDKVRALVDAAQAVKDYRYDPNIGIKLCLLELGIADLTEVKE